MHYSFTTLIALIAFGSVACGRETPTTEPATAQGTPVAAITLSAQDIARRISVSAPVEPRVHIRLASRATGSVERVLKEEGDRVAAGDLLAELDMSEARAELSRAEAEEERARLDYQRMSELRSRGSLSPADYQQSRANLRFAESERDLWRTRLAFGRIVAPQAGVISHRYIEPGEAVQAQDTLFEISALDELVLRPGLSELDVVHLSLGQAVTVELDALPKLQLAAEIRRIFPTADTHSRLITVEIALAPEAAEAGVRPGFLGRVSLDVDRREQVLALPSVAIGRQNDTGAAFVFVIQDNRLHERLVSEGASRGGWTEISAGLEPGDVILASNPIDMREQQRVRIVEHRD